MTRNEARRKAEAGIAGKIKRPPCFCSKCRKRIESKSRTGKCMDCLHPIRRIPADRRDDFELLRQRLGNSEAAAAWILAGKPVAPSRAPGACKKNARDVVRQVSARLDVHERDILGPSHFDFVVHARAVVATVLNRSGMSLAAIGRRLGRDHTTIRHAVRSLPKYAAKNPRLLDVVEELAA